MRDGQNYFLAFTQLTQNSCADITEVTEEGQLIYQDLKVLCSSYSFTEGFNEIKCLVIIYKEANSWCSLHSYITL